jgi:hypothetical protein
MIRRLTLGRQSDIRPGHLKRRLEAAQAYLHVSFTDTTLNHASS